MQVHSLLSKVGVAAILDRLHLYGQQGAGTGAEGEAAAQNLQVSCFSWHHFFFTGGRGGKSE